MQLSQKVLKFEDDVHVYLAAGHSKEWTSFFYQTKLMYLAGISFLGLLGVNHKILLIF